MIMIIIRGENDLRYKQQAKTIERNNDVTILWAMRFHTLRKA